MSSALKPIMNIPQTAIGKGRVGEPAPPPAGKEGVLVKVALFFDGTMNNRTNTRVRLTANERIKDGSKKDLILDEDKKDMLSSYANYYSNVAILEMLNKERVPKNQQVSVYVEGIGTVNYEKGVPSKDKHGHDEVDKQGRKVIPEAVADIGNDQIGGYAYGTSFTGIVDRVTQGIRQAKNEIQGTLKKKQYIERITINVIGFSRGAAAARHFVSRYEGFRGVWPSLETPELVVNFVGLFETVSSYYESGSKTGSAIRDLSGRLFKKNVGELQLALGGLPKRVVHLTAQDEMRRNFSLTTIESSLQAGNAFQVSLPGVHSDIGGGYVERDPDNPTMDPSKKYPKEPNRPAIRELNQENRTIFNQAEKRQLVAEGWYTDGTNGTPNQFHPDLKYYLVHEREEDHREAVARKHGFSYQRVPFMGDEYGSRYLTNEYQYVALYLMRLLAQNGLKPGQHTPMVFEELTMEDGIYQVPPDLVAVRDHFKTCISGQKMADGYRYNELDFATAAQDHQTRNKYLHRSSRILLDIEDGKTFLTWLAYRRANKDRRKVFSDLGKSAEGKAVVTPKLEEEAAKETVTAAAPSTPAGGEGPGGNGMGELNAPLEEPEAPPEEQLPEETGTSELNHK